MAIQLNDLKLNSAATTLLRRLPAANSEVLAAADRTAAINQDLITTLRPDLIGRPDLLADSSQVDTAKAAAILAAVDAGLLGTLRPDLIGAVLRPDLSRLPASDEIARVRPGDLITADTINAIIEQLNKLRANASVTLGGDVTGAASASRVVALQGRGIASTAPAQGQVLGFANGNWQPTTLPAATLPPVAMRLVAAGTLAINFVSGLGNQYQILVSHFGNLRVLQPPGGFDPILTSVALMFDGYDPGKTWVVHTAQRQLASGRNNEQPQLVTRVDPAANAGFPNAQPTAIGLSIFNAAGRPAQLAGELYVEIYQPPLTFTALPLVTDFAVAAISTVEANRINNPPRTAEPPTAPATAPGELLVDPVVNPVFTGTVAADRADANTAPATVSSTTTSGAINSASASGAVLAGAAGTLASANLRTGIADTVLRADTAGTVAIPRGGVDVGNAMPPDDAGAAPKARAARSRKSAATAATAPAKARKR